MLISFNLASDAVRCAMQIQVEARKQKIPLKIGIHEGEMVFEGADVLGDGVNVASRLQEMSDEGSIIISDAVNRDIKNKAGITTQFIKEETLKNVDEPVKVFKVISEHEKKEMTNEKKDKTNNTQLIKRRNLIIILFVILVIVIVFKLFLPIKKTTPSVPPAPANPSIAVLPFDNYSPDPDNEYFCLGMVEEILAHLHKIKDLDVKSRTSSEQYRDPDKDLIIIAEELGVLFILEGSVRKVGNDLRITAQLIDGSNGNHLWAETYDGKYSDKIFEFQSRVAKQIASSMNAAITPNEGKRIEKLPTSNLNAYDFYIKAEHEKISFHKERNKEHLKSAHKLIDQALGIDPGFVNAIVSKGSIFEHENKYDSAILYAEKAIKIDPEYAGSYSLKGEVSHNTGKYELALVNFEKAYSLSSDIGFWGYWSLARAFGFQRNYVDALKFFIKSSDAESPDMSAVNFSMGLIFLQIGEYELSQKYGHNAYTGRFACLFLPLYSNSFLAGVTTSSMVPTSLSV